MLTLMSRPHTALDIFRPANLHFPTGVKEGPSNHVVSCQSFGIGSIVNPGQKCNKSQNNPAGKVAQSGNLIWTLESSETGHSLD